MSKYDKLWEYVAANGEEKLMLSYDDIDEE